MQVRRRCILAATFLGLLFLVLGGMVASLCHRAQQAEDALRSALSARNLAKVEYMLSVADSALYRHVDGSLSDLVYRAKAWQARVRRHETMLERELASLEGGKASIRSLPLLRRAELESALRALPDSMQVLRARWEKLCRQEQQELEEQREELKRRFAAPLPPLPEPGGSPARDDAELYTLQQQLRQMAGEWDAAQKIFGLEGETGERLRERLEAIHRQREEIAALRRCIALLPSARTYAQYRKFVTAFSPTAYEPARRMVALQQRLPQEDSLRDQMQDHGRQLPPGMLAAARHALLEGGPSFTPDFPASARQLQLMEDLFSYTGLQKVVYEMSAATLPRVIVEERPEVSEESVRFTPSPLTPGYSLNTPRRITWHNPQAVFIRRIDCTPLLREPRIARKSFFHTANLPALLEALLRVEQEECPELARAFVYHRLLEVMRVHEWPTMLGVAYAPTLRADARSFARLTHALGIELKPGCWFESNEVSQRAEEACKRWFTERRHRRYAEEIARNFGALVQVHPRYIGFVAEDGSARLFRHLPDGTLLWYLAEGGLTTSPLGEELEAAVPFSPVFIVAKD